MADETHDDANAEIHQVLSAMLAESPELQEFIESFAGTLPSRLDAMQDALRKESYDRLKALARSLKEAGRSHGLDALSREAATIERAARDHALEQITQKLDDLNQLIRSIHDDLSKPRE